jgi:dTDP-4-amino-4,6-dideoxygalactose transaminase
VQAKLPYLQGWLDRKYEIAQYYSKELAGYYITPIEHDWGQHSYYVYVVEHVDRDRVRTALLEQGIQTNIHYANPAHSTPAFAPWHRSLPVTERKSATIFSIPVYPHLTDTQVEYIASKCKEVA